MPTCIEMSAFCNLHGVVVVVYINVVVILCNVLCMVSGESFLVATCTVWWWLYVVVTLCSVVTSLLDKSSVHISKGASWCKINTTRASCSWCPLQVQMRSLRYI